MCNKSSCIDHSCNITLALFVSDIMTYTSTMYTEHTRTRMRFTYDSQFYGHKTERYETVKREQMADDASNFLMKQLRNLFILLPKMYHRVEPQVPLV